MSGCPVGDTTMNRTAIAIALAVGLLAGALGAPAAAAADSAERDLEVAETGCAGPGLASCLDLPCEKLAQVLEFLTGDRPDCI